MDMVKKTKWYLPTRGAAIGLALFLIGLVVGFFWSEYDYSLECKELCELYGEKCEESRYALWQFP